MFVGFDRFFFVDQLNWTVEFLAHAVGNLFLNFGLIGVHGHMAGVLGHLRCTQSRSPLGRIR